MKFEDATKFLDGQSARYDHSEVETVIEMLIHHVHFLDKGKSDNISEADKQWDYHLFLKKLLRPLAESYEVSLE